MESIESYRIKLDKVALLRFFIEEPCEESIQAVYDVVKIVVHKHFSSYYHLRSEFMSMCLCKCYEVRSDYEEGRNVYSWVYTLCRNEIGNYLVKRSPEYYEDLLVGCGDIEFGSSSDLVDIPLELSNILGYISGDKRFEEVIISNRCAIDLLLFSSRFIKFRLVRCSEDLLDSVSKEFMYNLLLKV